MSMSATQVAQDVHSGVKHQQQIAIQHQPTAPTTAACPRDDDDQQPTNNHDNNNHHELQEQQVADFKYRVGYWWSEKKSQKFNATELGGLFAERQCQLVKIDLDRPIEEQGPFSLIVHKISDILVKADQGDAAAKKTVSAFENYVRKHPETVILDPLDNNRALLDRYKQYRLIEQSGPAKEGVVFTPPFVHLTSTNIDVNRGRIRRSKITFPIVCKPTLAQGSTGAHQMCIIFNEAGLKDVKPPCVAQSFVNHNAKLFKIFVIRDRYYIMERPSLKNFQAGDQETVFFYSHDISKPNSSSSLTELDESDKLNLERLVSEMRNLNTTTTTTTTTTGTMNGNTKQDIINDDDKQDHEDDDDFTISKLSNINGSSSGPNSDHSKRNTTQHQQQGNHHQEHDNNNSNHTNQYSPLMPSKERLSKIVKIFSDKLGLTFYGIDVIIENDTSRYAIIDMNTFPGYDGVENFLSIFRDIVCDAIPKDTDHQYQMLQMKINKRKPTEIDSGIEST